MYLKSLPRQISPRHPVDSKCGIPNTYIPNNTFRNSFSTKLYFQPTRQLEHSLYMEEWEGNYPSSISQGSWQMSRFWRTLVSALF